MDSDGDDYEPSGSEQDYDEEEREIMEDLRAQRKQREKQQDKNNEVLLFSDSDDDDDDADDVQELMRDSDIEGAEDDDDELPDTMNWGKKKSAYYNTDFVDPDYSSYTAQEEELALAEEEEAKKMQLRIAKQMKESDYGLDDIVRPTAGSDAEQATQSAEVIKVTTDLAGLNERERLQLLLKDSPEFMGVTQDFQQYLSEVQELTSPVLKYVQEHNVPMVPALKYACIYEKLLLSYCCNVSYYLLLKAKRKAVKVHPVVKRLVQVKQLREQLMPRYENFIRPQLEALLERIQDGDVFTVLTAAERKVKLQILDKYEKSQHAEATDNAEDANEDSDAQQELEQQATSDEEDEELAELDARRGITYQIAKNKGLMPHRKKELRNPRVKHRGKYRKALIRRRGAVRTVRKEVKRYGGEISGIKATVTKSVKFKT